MWPKNVWKSILHVKQRHEEGLQLSNVEHLQLFVEAVITNAFKIIIVMKKRGRTGSLSDLDDPSFSPKA